jgi:hypothetical protein
MSPKQKKIAAKAPPPNKIDAKDFAVLKAEKAKGRGMGLQDEKIKPGKVMKAKRGKMFDGYLSTFDASAEASTPKAQRGVTTIVGVRPGAEIGKGKKKFKSMEAMRTAKGFRTIDGKQETSSEFNKRRMALAAAKKTASASRIGKIALGIGAAGVAAQQYLKSKMNKKKDVEKKMGGGMMKKYSVGGGADSGNVGEMKSRIAVAVDRLKKAHKNTMGRRSGPMGDRLTDNDMEKIKNLVGKNKAARPIQKKMGGGMMQRPMGYKDGTKPGAGPLGGAGQAARGLGALGAAGRPSKQQTPGPSAGRPASQEQNKRKGPDLIVMMPVKEGPAKQNTTIKTVKIKNRMSGGMMKPMGYRSGTMVKARGCKLGRTRPTKIT